MRRGRQGGLHHIGLTLWSFTLVFLVVGCESHAPSGGDEPDVRRIEVERVGAIEERWGEEGSFFGSIRDVEVDGKGRIYIVDELLMRVLVFDQEGREIGGFGRPGEGPGEFGEGSMRTVNLSHDVGVHVGVAGWTGRLVEFTADGDHLRDVPFTGTDGVPQEWDSRGGSLAVAHRPESELVPGGRDTLVLYPIDVRDGQAEEGIGLPLIETSRTDGRYMFAAVPLWAISPDGRIAVASSTGPEIVLYGVSGAPTDTVAVNRARKRVTEEDKEILRSWYERWIGETGAPPSEVTRIVQRFRVEDVYPTVTKLFFGPAGTLWVQRPADVKSLTDSGRVYRFDEGRHGLGSRGRNEWDVFDAAGELIGLVVLPPAFNPHTSRGDLLYGVVSSATGSDSVQWLRVQLGLTTG